MSDSIATDASVDAERQAFLAKRRAARKVKSRKRRATSRQGAGGVRGSPGPSADQDSYSTENLSQKAPLTEGLAPLPYEQVAESVADVLSQKDPSICFTELPCVVYARPANDRLLLVTFDDKTHGKVVVRPQERVFFGPGKRVWVKWQGRDLYVLAGRYNRFGVRVDLPAQ
jgi:hypothetical protein